jgi:hypothetical protein
MFWNVEARTGLYILFKTVCDYYGLIPEDNYTIPSEAEGIDPATESRSSVPPLILKREPSGPGPEDSDNSTIIEGLTDHTLSTAGTTKRHRHSPSVGATAVSTVVEESEEEEEHSKELPRPISQIFELTPKDDSTAQQEEPEQPGKKAEAVAAEEPASPAPKSVPAEVELQKQSASDEAKADPTPQIEEKQGEDEGNVPNDAGEAEAPDVKTVDSESPETKELEDEPTERKNGSEVDESSATATEPETIKTDIKSATETDDKPAEEEK